MKLSPFGGYTPATRNAPVYHVGYLSFRGGNPMLKRSSLTGGGFIYQRDNRGTFQPTIVLHSGVTTSLLGGGTLPARPGFLQSLLRGSNG